MFERLRAFVSRLSGKRRTLSVPDETSVAVVVLALEVIRADGVVEPSEKKTLEALIRDHFHLDHAHYAALVTAARKEERGDSIEHYRFATHLRRHLSDAEKGEFIDILWSLVDKDKRNELEDHMILRIAEMIGSDGLR